MRRDHVLCPLCGRSVGEVREVEARIERMLDAAENAGVDLWALEVRRQRLELDLAEFTHGDHRTGPEARRAEALRRSIELEVEVLATAYKEMAVRAGE